APFGRALAAHEQLHRQSWKGLLQVGAELPQVLPSQDLGGRHDNGLQTRRVGHRDASGGNSSLARTHVAVEEAIHRYGPGHVLERIPRRLLLCASQLETKTHLEGIDDLLL